MGWLESPSPRVGGPSRGHAAVAAILLGTEKVGRRRGRRAKGPPSSRLGVPEPLRLRVELLSVSVPDDEVALAGAVLQPRTVLDAQEPPMRADQPLVQERPRTLAATSLEAGPRAWRRAARASAAESSEPTQSRATSSQRQHRCSGSPCRPLQAADCLASGPGTRAWWAVSRSRSGPSAFSPPPPSPPPPFDDFRVLPHPS